MMWQMGAKNDRTATLDGKEGKSEEGSGKGEREKGLEGREMGYVASVLYAACAPLPAVSARPAPLQALATYLGSVALPKKLGGKQTASLGWECSR